MEREHCKRFEALKQDSTHTHTHTGVLQANFTQKLCFLTKI